MVPADGMAVVPFARGTQTGRLEQSPPTASMSPSRWSTTSIASCALSRPDVLRTLKESRDDDVVLHCPCIAFVRAPGDDGQRLGNQEVDKNRTLRNLHLIVSQWNTNTNWPYRAMQFVTGVE